MYHDMEGFELIALNPLSGIVSPHAIMAKDGVYYDVSLIANAYVTSNIAKSLSIVLTPETINKEEKYRDLFKYWKLINDNHVPLLADVLEGVNVVDIGPTEFVFSNGCKPPYCSHWKELSGFTEGLDLNRNINRDQLDTVLESQSGGRYDRSRYANNGRPDDSYTAKKNTAKQSYRKMFMQDGSVRMVPYGETIAANRQPQAEPKSTTANLATSFSGLSMESKQITRDLTTEKEFAQREKEKRDQQVVSHSPSQIAMQDDGQGNDGDVGW
jgi:hypothetical protein